MLPLFEHVGEEAASAMGVSPLAIGIIKIINDAFRYKSSLNGSDDDNYKKMVEYNTKKLKPSFEKIVDSQLNMTVNLIVDDRNGGGPFSCHPYIGNSPSISAFFRANRPTKKRIEERNVDTLVAELQNIIDPDSGALKRKEVKFKDSKKLLKIDLYFSTKLGFFSREFHGFGDDEYTPTELAGILVHELGHMVTLLEESGRYAEIHGRIEEVRDAILALPLKERIDAGVKVSKVIRSNESIRNNDMFYKASSEGEELIRKIQVGKSESNFVSDGLGVINVLVATLLMFMFAPITFLLIDRRIESMTLIPEYLKNDQHADIDELFSDSFAVNHGLGADLASGLDKTTKAINLDGFGIQIRHQKASYLMLNMMIPLAYDIGATPDIIGGRFKNMERHVIKLLKSDKLNSAQREHYNKEYVKLRSIILSRKPGVLGRMRSSIVKLGARLTGRWYNTKFDDSFKSEVDKLDRIMHSDLVYTYSQLKSIMD